MPIFPATIPHIRRDDKYICQDCVKRLALIVCDQCSRYPIRIVIETDCFELLIRRVRADGPVVVIVRSSGGVPDKVFGDGGLPIESLGIE